MYQTSGFEAFRLVFSTSPGSAFLLFSPSCCVVACAPEADDPPADDDDASDDDDSAPPCDPTPSAWSLIWAVPNRETQRYRVIRTDPAAE